MEPVFTAMGEAAGLAAHVALRDGVPGREVNVAQVQHLIHESGGKTIYLSDVERDSPHFRAAQYFGTRGYFHGLVDVANLQHQPLGARYRAVYAFQEADLDQPITESLAKRWIAALDKPEDRRAALSMPGLKPDGVVTRGVFLDRLYQLVGIGN